MQVGIGKIAFLPVEKSPTEMPITAENLCPYATVVWVHDGALAEEYTVLSTTFMVVENC